MKKILLINPARASEQELDNFLPGDRNSIYFVRILKRNLEKLAWKFVLESASWRLDAGSPKFEISASIFLGKLTLGPAGAMQIKAAGCHAFSTRGLDATLRV